MPKKRRLLVTFLLVAAALVAGGWTGASVVPVAADVAAVVPSETGFAVDSIVPAAESALGRARAALASTGADAALQIARDSLAQTSGDERSELQYFIARAERARGQTRAALTALDAVAREGGPLASMARLDRAELLTDRPQDVLREVGSLTTYPWSWQRRAQELEALALARLGRWQEAAPKLRALVQSAPTRSGAYTVAAPLADWLASQTTDAARIEAIQLYRRIATRVPRSNLGTDAEAKASRLLAQLPRAVRRSIQNENLADAFVRADVLYDSMQHEDAERAYAAIAARSDVTPEDRCRAWLREGQSLVRRRARAEGVAVLQRVTEECSVEDTRAWARFGAGKASVSLGRRDDATAHFQALLREAPRHRLADDALYRSALVAIDNGDANAADSALRSLVATYTDGDMRGEARFRLAWTHRLAGRFAEALQELDASIAEGPMEVAEDIQGRAKYWRARTLDDLHRQADAVTAYEGLVRSLPLSFYGQQAWQRLRERDAARAERLSREILSEDAPGSVLTFPWRPEMRGEAFRRAVALYRVGENSRAREELSALGYLRDDAEPETMWLAAAMMDRGGDAPQSITLIRRKLLSYLATQPRGRARALWRVAYPRAHATTVTVASSESTVPAALIRAIAREESSFDSSSLSAVGARGMIQLMPATARRFAQPLNLPSDASAMSRPEVNLRIGAAYLQFLLGRYTANPGAVPAAYNAGEGAVDRWRTQRPNAQFDAWVEEIPYEETRRYTRRVLQSYGVYAALEGEALPHF